MKNAAFIKKALPLLLALSLLFVFVACSNGGDVPSAVGTEPSFEAEASGDKEEVFVKPENYATVLTVTINPQFRLYLDADGIVLAIESVNKDAEEVIDDLSFEEDNYESVIEKIVTKSEEKGYVKKDVVINVEITETKDATVNTVEILDKITVTVNQTATKLELKVEVKTEDKSTIEETPTESATESAEQSTASSTEPQKTDPTEATTTVPTQCSHTYKDATCTAPKTCSECGVTEGSAAGHDWSDATCTAPKTCKACKATEGIAMGHSYKDATCTAPKTCQKCCETVGEVLPHNYQSEKCTSCECRQLGYGKWQAQPFISVEGYLVIVDFKTNDGIWAHVYLDIESGDPELIQQLLQNSDPTITYQGKTYIMYAGAGDSIYYKDVGENSITVHIDDPSDNCPDKFTLQRQSKNQLVVTAVYGCGFYGIKVGTIFTYVE